MAYWITAIEISFVLQFLFIFYQYKSPNFLIQAFGVMVIILGVFMVPNRCIFKIAVSLFVSISFLAMSGRYIGNIKAPEFSAGIVYLCVVFILSGIISVNNDFNKRIQHVNRLELVRLSDTDYLTGVYNRSKLDQELKHWIGYSKRYNLPLSLIILDFDDFKAVNDTYGHLVGDSVILETVDLINKNIRKSDVFARWGGEEFLIVLPNTDKSQAADMAERFRRKIENHRFEKANSMTCSFGEVQLQSEEGIETLFQRADRILYEAKKAGKNKVVS
jgi:diguanylate cyclase (GGDEF)-like protein